MTATKTIVVLGAGPAALPIIRQNMVNLVLKRDDLKMVVVAPNTHFHWPVAMPRAVVPGQLADEKVLIPLDATFANFPADKFEFVQAVATALDTAANSVTVKLSGDGTARDIAYHTLIIATGTRTREDAPFKTIGNTEATRQKLHELQGKIAKAKTIVVAGGGLSGVETAGELGFEYSRDKQKEVIFIHSDALPLAPPAIDSVRKAAKNELERLNVKIVANTSVVGTSVEGDDTVLQLRAADGSTSTLKAQAYIPATGNVPNTDFLPAALRDGNGYAKQTTRLRVEGLTNVLVVGDAGSLQPSQLAYAEGQSVHLVKNLAAYIDGGDVPEYAVDPKPIFGVTVGRSRATGQMGSFKIFSIVIWFMKGRYLGTDYAHLWAAGKKTMMNTFEK